MHGLQVVSAREMVAKEVRKITEKIKSERVIKIARYFFSVLIFITLLSYVY